MKLFALVTLLLLAPLVNAQTVLNASLAGRENNVFVVTVSLDDGEKHLILDTASNLSTFDKQSFRNHLADAGDHVEDTRGFGGAVPLEMARVDFTLGSKHIKQKAFRSDLSELSKAAGMRIDGVIGADILSHFESVTFDYKRHVVVFK